MIEFTEVTKRYGARGAAGVEALAAISLRFTKAETVGIVGPNGAGKSTLLGLALGYLRPSTGRVSIAGDSPRRWVRRNGAAFLPERFTVPPEWPVSAALLAFARLERDAPVFAARDALERFGLGPHAARPAGTLSRGLTQRLGLAQATLARRELVVLDEPTEGLDPRGRVLLRETLAGLRDRGATVLLASHDLTEIERVADRAVLLDAGRVRETFTTRATGEPDLYTIRLAAPSPDLPALFPDATQIGPDSWMVRVAGAADLTTRLAAIIEAGAVIAEVSPAAATLEDRVRASLGGGPTTGEGPGGAGSSNAEGERP